MLIKDVKDDIFTSGAEALVNPVNCVGICGKGLALEFKNKYMCNYLVYKDACSRGNMQLGSVLVVNLDTSSAQRKLIINFPTKSHWKCDSYYEKINDGLNDMVRKLAELEVRSVAIPALGCGLGGLRWDLVRESIVKTFLAHPPQEIDVLLYPPK